MSDIINALLLFPEGETAVKIYNSSESVTREAKIAAISWLVSELLGTNPLFIEYCDRLGVELIPEGLIQSASAFNTANES